MYLKRADFLRFRRPSCCSYLELCYC